MYVLLFVSFCHQLSSFSIYFFLFCLPLYGEIKICIKTYNITQQGINKKINFVKQTRSSKSFESLYIKDLIFYNFN